MHFRLTSCFRRAAVFGLSALGLAVLFVLLDARYSKTSWANRHAIPYPHSGSSLANTDYSQVLVVASLKSDDMSWIDLKLPELRHAIYVVDDLKAALRPPQNKGRESTVFLSYIIDNYDWLPDITIFIHAHASSWHNEFLWNQDAAEMIKRFNRGRVVEKGYFNLRCGWEPGCPAWLNLSNGTSGSLQHQTEEANMQNVWKSLHGDVSMPQILAQPCCSQFAASRQSIRAVPLQRWKHFRNWLLRTELIDEFAGRVWEYTWQYVLTGNPVFCPAMNVCYCQAYGACFGSGENFQAWWDLRKEAQDLWDEYLPLVASGGDAAGLKTQLEKIEGEKRLKLEDAFARGMDANYRALEAD